MYASPPRSIASSSSVSAVAAARNFLASSTTGVARGPSTLVNPSGSGPGSSGSVPAMRRLGSAATQNSTASINPVGNAGSVQGVVQKKHKHSASASPVIKQSLTQLNTSETSQSTPNQLTSPTSSGAIQAIVRSRPLFPHEMQNNTTAWKSSYSATSVALELDENAHKVSMGTRVFEVDGVFDAPRTQEQVYQRARPLIDAVLNGRNCTIFAYGQTSAGKTYTMQGDMLEAELGGVIPRAIDQLFASLAKDAQSGSQGALQLSISYLEIYNECIRDLLTPADGAPALSNSASTNPLSSNFPFAPSSHSIFSQHSTSSSAGLVQPAPFVTSTSSTGFTAGPLGSSSNLDIRETKDGAFYVPRLMRVPVKTRAEALRWLEHGLTNRTVSSTEMNERSSRSHTILTLYVSLAGAECDPEAVGAASGVVAQLNLVDLAGSERIALRHSETQMKETSNINKSLVCLGNVIAALSKQGVERESHINYRDSKLTKLLKNSIGGDSLTLLIACISPAQHNNEETLSTLRFACRAKKVQNRAVLSSDPRDALIMSLQREVLAMKRLLQQTQAAATSQSENSHSLNDAQSELNALNQAHKELSSTSNNTGFEAQQREIQSRLERLEAMVTAARAAKESDPDMDDESTSKEHIAGRAMFASPHSSSAPATRSTSPLAPDAREPEPEKLQNQFKVMPLSSYRRPPLGLSSSASLLPTFAYALATSSLPVIPDSAVLPPMTTPASASHAFFPASRAESVAEPSRKAPLASSKLLPLSSASLLPSSFKPSSHSSALLPKPASSLPLSSMSLMPKRPSHMTPAAVQALAAQAAGSSELDAAYQQHQAQQSSETPPSVTLAGLLAAPLIRAPLLVSPKHLNEDSIAESAPIVTTHQNTAKTEVTESVAVNESGDMEHLRSQLSSLSSELSRERQRYESLESHCTSLQTELNDTKSELKRVLEVHAQELEASHLALTSFYAHVEDLQQQHEADRVRNNTMRLEREAERAAEKEQWAAQLLQEVDTARVEAEGKIEQAQMSFDLIVENLRAELGAEKRALAASEVAHLAAMQKQEEVLATTVQTLSAQYKQTLESHASEIEMLKAAAIEMRAAHEREVTQQRVEFEAATEELMKQAEAAALALEAAELAPNSDETQKWKQLALDREQALIALQARLDAQNSASQPSATQTPVTPTKVISQSSVMSPTAVPKAFATEKEFQEALAARDFSYSRERSQWQNRERTWNDAQAKLVAAATEAENERIRTQKRHQSELDEAKVKFENAVRAEHTALSRINETQLQLEACEAELASVRASTKARLVQAEQVLTQLLSANDVRETELARLRAAEDARDGERALSRAAIESRDVSISELQRKVDELNSINARLMWERDQWRREKERAREATAAVAASMGLKMASPLHLNVADEHTPEALTPSAHKAKTPFTPLERFPSFAILPFCPPASDA